MRQRTWNKLRRWGGKRTPHKIRIKVTYTNWSAWWSNLLRGKKVTLYDTKTVNHYHQNKTYLNCINWSRTFKFHLFNADPGSERGRSRGVEVTVLSTAPAGKGLILIFLSSITVSPFSSPTSAGSFDIAISSSCLSRGKYRGSNLQCLTAYNQHMNDHNIMQLLGFSLSTVCISLCQMKM